MSYSRPLTLMAIALSSTAVLSSPRLLVSATASPVPALGSAVALAALSHWPAQPAPAILKQQTKQDNRVRRVQFAPGTSSAVVEDSVIRAVQQESDARSRGELAIPAISGLSYHKAREILVQEGWIPLTQRHFYPQEEPSLQYGNGKIFWNLGYWEVVACSGTAEGFCRFEFSDPSGRKLVVVTAGMEDPSIPAQAMVNSVFFDEENSP